MHRKFKSINVFVISLSFILATQAQASNISDEAQRLYQAHQQEVFQIRVINKATGNKFAIGSGFHFAKGIVATNYHVISRAADDPQDYKIEYLAHDGSVANATILNVDVIHDLAILKVEDIDAAYLTIGSSQIDKGVRIYSMGNPHDLGMTIVEGIYNGLMEKSLYRKILFSGSINPGMSGGPALNQNGEVIGINVATAGDQISFLIPVEFLSRLYEQTQAASVENSGEWKGYVQSQLVGHQQEFVDNIIGYQWTQQAIGPVTVPGEITNVVKCWSESRNKGKEYYHYAYVSCSNDDEIYLSDQLSTGKIYYKYNWIVSKHNNPLLFYNAYEFFFSYLYNFVNAGEEDVTNFNCAHNFVAIEGRDYKASYCARNYKKYPQLYDFDMVLVSVDQKLEGLVVELAGLGMTKDNINHLVKKFMENIKWPK